MDILWIEIDIVEDQRVYKVAQINQVKVPAADIIFDTLHNEHRWIHNAEIDIYAIVRVLANYVAKGYDDQSRGYEAESVGTLPKLLS